MSRAPALFSAAPFAVLWLGYYATIGVLNPYLPLWLSHLGYSTLAIGAFASLQSWTRIVAPYGWGWLADHGGRRVALLRLAAVLSAGAAAALWFAGAAGAWPLALVIAALYLANGAIVPIGETLLLRHLHDEAGLDARRYGRVRVWGSVGFMVSVLAFGALLQRAGIATLPLVVGALFVLLVAAVWRVPPQPDEGAASAQPRDSVWPVLCRPEVVWFFAGLMAMVLAHTALYAFFSLYLDGLGYGKQTVGLLWAVSVAAEIVFFALAGHRFAMLADHAWLMLAAYAAALRFAATAAFGHQLAVRVVAQALHALTFAAQHLACTSVIARHFPDRLRTRGSALYATLGYGVPGVVGGVAGGWLSERLGLAAVFWAAALAGLLSAGCCAMARRTAAQAHDHNPRP